MSLAAARAAALVVLLAAPLAAGWLAGLPAGFTTFPPAPPDLAIPGFSPWCFAALLLLGLLVLGFLAAPARFGLRPGVDSDFAPFEWQAHCKVVGRFPAWGIIGVVLLAAAWAAAWSRPAWLGAAAEHTFFPLWLGYILTVDAWVYRRAGTSPASRRPRRWLAMFPASCLAWWYYEFLNRFVQNWVYLGVDHFPAGRYVAFASLAFATVIPAVLTTAALLSTFPWFRKRFARRAAGPEVAATPTGAWLWLTGGGALGLALMPYFPVELFALVWIAPLLVAVGLLERAGAPTGFGHLPRGDWGPVVTLAVAALVCGFFWELWNYLAMPKWVYRVPWVNRHHVFEMPLAGYLGYLPFGPACWAFHLLLMPASRGSAGQR